MPITNLSAVMTTLLSLMSSTIRPIYLYFFYENDQTVIKNKTKVKVKKPLSVNANDFHILVSNPNYPG